MDKPEIPPIDPYYFDRAERDVNALLHEARSIQKEMLDIINVQANFIGKLLQLVQDIGAFKMHEDYRRKIMPDEPPTDQ